MKEEILKKLEELKYMDFSELQEQIKGFEGESSMCLSNEYNNIIVWPFCSSEAISALVELKKEGKIEFDVCNNIQMMMYRVFPVLPVAGRLYAYKKPRWLPTLVKLTI
jgi:hypothetical protein